MPIFEYRCAACGHCQDHLMRRTDPPKTECPVCRAGAAAYVRQLSRPAPPVFNGTGYYATDFRGGSK